MPHHKSTSAHFSKCYSIMSTHYCYKLLRGSFTLWSKESGAWWYPLGPIFWLLPLGAKCTNAHGGFLISGLTTKSNCCLELVQQWWCGSLAMQMMQMQWAVKCMHQHQNIQSIRLQNESRPMMLLHHRHPMVIRHHLKHVVGGCSARCGLWWPIYSIGVTWFLDHCSQSIFSLLWFPFALTRCESMANRARNAWRVEPHSDLKGERCNDSKGHHFSVFFNSFVSK